MGARRVNQTIFQICFLGFTFARPPTTVYARTHRCSVLVNRNYQPRPNTPNLAFRTKASYSWASADPPVALPRRSRFYYDDQSPGQIDPHPLNPWGNRTASRMPPLGVSHRHLPVRRDSRVTHRYSIAFAGARAGTRLRLGASMVNGPVGSRTSSPSPDISAGRNSRDADIVRGATQYLCRPQFVRRNISAGYLTPRYRDRSRRNWTHSYRN